MTAPHLPDIAGNSTYCGPAPQADAWLSHWNLDPLLLVGLALAALVAWRLPAGRRRAGLAAVGAGAVAFVSPLCALTVALFSARSLHHLLLVAGAAPLLALAWPLRRAVSLPAAVLALTVPLWAWHVPSLYAAALADPLVYWAMQAALVAGAWLYWAAVARAPVPLAIAATIGGAAQMGMLGALLTFAPRALYAEHFATTVSYGIGPLADQQLAGLVMWVPGLVPFALTGAWLVSRSLRAPIGGQRA